MMQGVLACISLLHIVVGDRSSPQHDSVYGILEDTPHQSSTSAPPALPPTVSSPLCIWGYWPLFIDQYTSNQTSPVSMSHAHDLNQTTYYMPDAFDGSTHGETHCPQSSYVRARTFNGDWCTDEHSYLTVSMFKTSNKSAVYNGSKALYYYNGTNPYTDADWKIVFTTPSTILNEWSTESGSGVSGYWEAESTVTATLSVESGGYLKINGNYVYTYSQDEDAKEPTGVSSTWHSIRHNGDPAPVECPQPPPTSPPSIPPLPFVLFVISIGLALALGICVTALMWFKSPTANPYASISQQITDMPFLDLKATQ